MKITTIETATETETMYEEDGQHGLRFVFVAPKGSSKLTFKISKKNGNDEVNYQLTPGVARFFGFAAEWADDQESE